MQERPGGDRAVRVRRRPVQHGHRRGGQRRIRLGLSARFSAFGVKRTLSSSLFSSTALTNGKECLVSKANFVRLLMYNLSRK